MINRVTGYSFIVFIRNQKFSKYQKTLSGQIGPKELKNNRKYINRFKGNFDIWLCQKYAQI